MVKVGRTGRDPRTRAGEITAVSGLLAPCAIAWCAPVSDMAAVEQAVHRMLGGHRVRKRREMFRVDVATAREVIEAVAGAPPASALPRAAPARYVPARPATTWRRRPRRSWPGSWRRRRHVPTPVRVAAGLAAIVSWFTLVQPHLAGGWLF